MDDVERSGAGRDTARGGVCPAWLPGTAQANKKQFICIR
jgi:hypothetical protein